MKICVLCGRDCAVGQKAANGKYMHYSCQAELPREERDPRLAAYPTGHAQREQ